MVVTMVAGTVGWMGNKLGSLKVVAMVQNMVDGSEMQQAVLKVDLLVELSVVPRVR